MRSPRTPALALIAWSLACMGPPADRPDPAPNAGDCATYEGVGLPLGDGVIVSCGVTSVSIAHDDPARVRWEYVQLYTDAGWILTEPKAADPVVSRGSSTLVFGARDEAVVIRRR